MSSGTARVMIKMYLHGEGRDWLYLTPLMNELKNHHQIGGYGTLAHWWGLMEHQPGDRDDGSWRNGHWRLTDSGREFVVGNLSVPKYVRLYNGKRLGLVGPSWSIRDALGKKFNYNELMNGITLPPKGTGPLNGKSQRTKRIIPRRNYYTQTLVSR